MKALEFITCGWYDSRDLKSRAITMTPKYPNSSEKKWKNEGGEKNVPYNVHSRQQAADQPAHVYSLQLCLVSTAASSTLHS